MYDFIKKRLFIIDYVFCNFSNEIKVSKSVYIASSTYRFC